MSKRKAISIADKQRIIQEVKAGTRKKKDIADEYGIPASTLSTIMKNEDRILSAPVTQDVKAKRARLAEFPDVEKCLVKWIQQLRENNVNIGGHLLKEKAEQFA